MKRRNIKAEIIICICLFIFVALAIEMNLLGSSNKKQVTRTSQIMLDQIENILINNKHTEDEILEDLKIDYVERANTVAYILDKNEYAKNNIEELKRIAELMSIDEINLFDSNGVIYSGTHSNYFGYSFDSGEQIAYFRPMLSNKNLTMCQDVTPNTAEAKSMMYAITWNSTKSYMVQVGIEPIRLLDALRENNVHEVVNQMPVYEGMNIYVADIKNGEILGATDKSFIGNTLYDNEILDANDDLNSIKAKSTNIKGYRTYCNYRQHGDYLIAITHSTRANMESFFVSISIELVWLLVASGIILYTLLKLVNANKRISSQMSILSSISDIYYSMHLIDLSDFSIEKLEGNELMDKIVDEGINASDMLKKIVSTTLQSEYIESALAFINLQTLGARMRGKNSIFMDTVDKNVGWLRVSFITVETDEFKNATKVIIATQIINEDKKREEELSIKANKDELTGLYNRRAYENDMLIYPDVPPEQDFVYAAIDINELKNANDEYGHAAGDEIIKGAAECLKKTFGNYGKVYRTGGDEFVSMFFADEEHLQGVVEDLEKMTAAWKGNMISSLTLSVGYVTKKEFPEETVVNMAKTADQRMYAAKSEYYSKKGVDRRGQAAAHKALCKLYTKILKINITNDTYSIVNMDESEKIKYMGFSDKISDWFINFGKSGQVHEDDLSNYLEKTNLDYLRTYFNQNTQSLSIFYRRKLGKNYKNVIMEMIPADDYTELNQTLYLYVKSIEK